MSRKEKRQNSHFEIIKPVANDHWPRGITFDKGFKLIGTPLSFSGARNPGLLFVSDVDDPMPARGGRVICTPETAAAIDAKGRELDVLTMPFNRSIRLGRMDIRLLPSGATVGSAHLEVSYKDRKILYSTRMRTSSSQISAMSKMTPKCDLLLINSPCAESAPPSPKATAKHLAAWVSQISKLPEEIPVIACGTMGAAITAALALKNLNITIHAYRPVYELLRRLSKTDISLPALLRLNKKRPKTGLILHLSKRWPASSFFNDHTNNVAYAGPGRTIPSWATNGFRMGETEDRRGLLRFIKNTGALRVALGPNCHRDMALSIGKKELEVHYIEQPLQIPLPLF